MASPTFCITELGGLLFAYAWIFLQIGEPTLGTCIFRPFTIVTALVLVLGGIAVKNQRICHIFGHVYGSTSARIVVKDAVLARVCGTLFLIDISLATLMVLLDLPIPIRVPITVTKHLVTCKAPSAIAAIIFEVLLVTFNVGILVYATILSYRTRNVSGMYSECKQIALCVYNVFLCTIVAAQSQILVTDEHLAGFYLPVSAVWVAATFTLAVLFGPKLWQFYRVYASGQLSALCPTSHVFPSTVRKNWGGSRTNAMLRGDLESDVGGRLLDFGFGVGLDIDSQSYGSSVGSVYSGHREDYMQAPVTKPDKLFNAQVYEGVLPMKRIFKIMPFMSLFTSWEMKRVIVFPAIRYFIIIGTDKQASTISYASAESIRRPELDSGQSAWHGFKVTGHGRWHDYIFQVESRESLRMWVRRFDPTSLSPANSGRSCATSPLAAELAGKSYHSHAMDNRSPWPGGGQIAKSRSVTSSATCITPSPVQEQHSLTPTIVGPNASTLRSAETLATWLDPACDGC